MFAALERLFPANEHSFFGGEHTLLHYIAMPTGWREERHRRLFIYQRHHAPGSKALLGNVPKLGGGEAVDVFAELTKRLRLSQMQEAAPHADGHVFAILPGESHLTL